MNTKIISLSKEQEIQKIKSEGDSLIRKGNLKPALTTFKQGLDKYPGDPRLIFSIAGILLSLKEFDNLEIILATYQPKHPKDCEIFISTTWSNLTESGAYTLMVESATTFTQFIKSDYSKATILIDTAIIYSHLNQEEQALKTLNNKLFKKPSFKKNRNNELNKTANKMMKLNQFEQASILFKLITTLEPDNENAWKNLGISSVNLKKVDDAINAFSHAAKLRPDLFHHFANLSHAYLDKGDMDNAIKNMKQAIVLNPEYIVLHQHLGTFYLENNQPDKASDTWVNAVKLMPKLKDIMETLVSKLPEEYQASYIARLKQVDPEEQIDDLDVSALLQRIDESSGKNNPQKKSPSRLISRAIYSPFTIRNSENN
jgi:tetratricopeptide (TPR) repeat protein